MVCYLHAEVIRPLVMINQDQARSHQEWNPRDTYHQPNRLDTDNTGTLYRKKHIELELSLVLDSNPHQSNTRPFINYISILQSTYLNAQPDQVKSPTSCSTRLRSLNMMLPVLNPLSLSQLACVRDPPCPGGLLNSLLLQYPSVTSASDIL